MRAGSASPGRGGAPPSAPAVATVDTNRLQELESLLAKKEAEYGKQKTELEKLKAMDRDALKIALPQAPSDLILSNRLAELNMYELDFNTIKGRFGPEDLAYQLSEANVKDWKRQVDERMDGVMLGLQFKLESTEDFVTNLKSGIEKLRAENQGGR